MASAVEALIVVALGLLGVAFFIHALMTNTADLVHVAGGLGAFAIAWAYGLLRTG
jgi:hypothetical protein